MVYHLIDIENIPKKWISIIDGISSDDVLILFILKENHNVYLNIDDVKNIVDKKIELNIIDCFKGKAKKNALDFQLVSYLGYLIHTDSENGIRIYTNDTGFDPVIDFWKDKGIDIEKIGF